MPASVLSTIPEPDCRALLAGGEVGRIVLSVDALPAALPVTYRMIANTIVFRTAPGTKLTAALDHAVVGFEVDNLDPASHSGWSVLVVGISDVVTDPTEITALDKSGIRSWLTTAEPHYVTINIDRISGRRLDHLTG
ncbi:MAG TPA: pyridoxamine 5'-phosphate oxidase family protein [Actinopolymorphaceae bacterium]|nr:pyridoxamine 5'-phosphate oxidase family protein [Actinopolymorphaceae bacterium]